MGLEHLGTHCQWWGGRLCTAGWGLPTTLLPEPWDSQKERFHGILSLFLSYLCSFSPLWCQLGPGRAGSKMTRSQGLGALCSGFLSTQFHTAHGLAATQLETCQNSIKSQSMSEQYENTCHPSPVCSPRPPCPGREGPSWPVSLISPAPSIITLAELESWRRWGKFVHRSPKPGRSRCAEYSRA